MKEYGPPHTTQKERFEGFAMAHLGLSCLGFFPFWLLILGMAAGTEGFGYTGAWGIAAVYLLAYFPLGMATAWLNNWTVPLTDRERWQAVIYPTAVAWAWVGVVVLSLSAANGPLLIMAFYASVLLAAPSSGLVLMAMPLWGAYDTLEALVLTGLLAGILPPLLFTWGSFWASGRAAKKTLRRGAQPVAPKA